MYFLLVKVFVMALQLDRCHLFCNLNMKKATDQVSNSVQHIHVTRRKNSLSVKMQLTEVRFRFFFLQLPGSEYTWCLSFPADKMGKILLSYLLTLACCQASLINILRCLLRLWDENTSVKYVNSAKKYNLATQSGLFSLFGLQN